MKRLIVPMMIGSCLFLQACSSNHDDNAHKDAAKNAHKDAGGKPHIFKAVDKPSPQVMKLYQQQEGLWHERYSAVEADGHAGRVSTSATQSFDIPTPVMLPSSGQGVVEPKPQKAAFVVARATADNGSQPLSQNQWGIALQVPQPLVKDQVALVRFDSGIVLALPWSTCTPQLGCVATLKMTGYQLDQLQNSIGVTISFTRFAGHEPVAVDLSLEGLDKAMDKLQDWATHSPLVTPQIVTEKPKGNYLLDKRKPLF